MSEQPNNPLHGITLEQVVTKLEQHFGWQELGKRINIKCFTSDPSVKSSLKFLRKTPWARDKVEQLFIANKLYQQVKAKPSSEKKQPTKNTTATPQVSKTQTQANENISTEPSPQKKRGRFAGNKNSKRTF